MPYIVNMKVIGQFRKDIYIVRDLINATYNILCHVVDVSEDDVREIERKGYGRPEVMGIAWESRPKYWVGSITAVTTKPNELIDVVGDMIDNKKVLGKVAPYYLDEVEYTDPKEFQVALQERGFALVGGRHLVRNISQEDQAQIIKDKMKRAKQSHMSPKTRYQVEQMFSRERRRKKSS